MNAITVFCASSPGLQPDYIQGAQSVGRFLAERDITLVYGGGCVGLMGALADAAIEKGGRVIGVIPQFLMDLEVGHRGLTELIIVDSMHERKLKMGELCDGVMALPGGFGTLEELVEMLTWSQLALHQKPIGILNTAGYYNSLLRFFAHMVGEGLLKEANRDLAIFDDDVHRLYQKMSSFERTITTKWSGANTKGQRFDESGSDKT